MICLTQSTNKVVLVRQDVTLAPVLMLSLVSETDKKRHWCKVVDSQEFADWVLLPFEIVIAGADSQNSQIALRDNQKGDYMLEIYGGSTYSESIASLTLMHSERARYN